MAEHICPVEGCNGSNCTWTSFLRDFYWFARQGHTMEEQEFRSLKEVIDNKIDRDSIDDNSTDQYYMIRERIR